MISQDQTYYILQFLDPISNSPSLGSVGVRKVQLKETSGPWVTALIWEAIPIADKEQKKLLSPY